MSSFYSREGARFVASSSTVGPWDPKLQHGSPVAALIATLIEQQISTRQGMRVAQLTLDFMSPVPVTTIDVKTSMVRPGKKIEMWSATVEAGERICARANIWVLHTKSNSNEEIRLDDPTPPMPETAATMFFKAVPRFGYGDAFEWRFSEGSFSDIGPATTWSRLKVEILEGEVVSPIARALSMVDSANGISAELDVKTHVFVPVSLTVSLTRPPESEWVGMRAVTQLASDGIGTTRARLFDSRGTIGRALQTLFVEARA